MTADTCMHPSVWCVLVGPVLQALAESAAQRVGQLEQQVKQLQDTSDANGQVLQGKMSNLDGEPPGVIPCSRVCNLEAPQHTYLQSYVQHCWHDGHRGTHHMPYATVTAQST